MNLPKFFEGDKVIGNSFANFKYRSTIEGWIGTVTKVNNCYFSAIDEFGTEYTELDFRYFDLYSNENIITTQELENILGFKEKK